MMRVSTIIIPVLLSIQLNAQNVDLGLDFVRSLKGITPATDRVQINDVQLSSNGNIFVGGYFSGTIDFDPDLDPTATVIRSTTGDNDIFLAKYNSNGELLNPTNVITTGGANTQYITNIVVDGQTIVVDGIFEGSTSFVSGIASSNTVMSNGTNDILLAKFDESLTNIWAYGIGSGGNDFSGGIAVDNGGNIYVTGSFIGTVDFDPSGNGTAISLTAPGTGSDIFVAKYNPDGELLWAHNFGGSGLVGDAGSDIAIDDSNNVYVTGVFNGNVDFDPGPGSTVITSSATVRSAFVAKYDQLGNLIWAKSILGAEVAGKIAVKNTGEVAITGYFQVNNADFDPDIGETLLPYLDNLPDTYIAIFDNDGSLLWAKSIGGPDSSLEIPYSVAFGEDNSVFVSGNGGGDIDFNLQGNSPFVLSTASSDGFVARYDIDGSLISAHLIGGVNADYETMLTINGGSIFLYGRQRSPSIDFDFSTSSTTATSSSGDDGYIAKYDYTGPKLVSNGTQTPVLGEDLLISLGLEDLESGIASAAVQYRDVSAKIDGPFKTVALVNTSGNTYQGSIPSDDFGDLGMEFRGVATNNRGVIGTTQLLSTNFSVPEGLTIPQKGTGNGSQEDYRIISVPLELANKTVKGIFEDDLGVYNPNQYRLFSYTDKTNELNASSSLEVGKGYWLIVAGADRGIDTGAGQTLNANRTSPFTMQLEVGWNLIGNPYDFNIAWADMKLANATLTEDLRVFNGSFVNGTQLEAMGGGFVFSDDVKTIGFPVFKNPAVNSGRVRSGENTSARKPLALGDWEVSLKLQQSNQVYDLGGIGMRSDSKIEYDTYDEVALPRFSNYLEINHSKKIHGYHLSMDIIPHQDEKIWEFTIESASAGSTSISWQDLTALPPGKKLVLFDVEKQWPIEMDNRYNYTFESTGAHRFKAIYGSETFVKREVSGDQFIFYGVYPNPVSDQSNLLFSIPESNESELDVKVRLYNTIGQDIANFTYQFNESGIQEQPLFLRDLSISAGLYIVEVQAGEIRKQSRILIK